jgi:hypothetical protein
MLTKIKRKVREVVRRREIEAEWRGFIAGMQYGKYLAEKEAKTK